jgi:hypothetical protein
LLSCWIESWLDCQIDGLIGWSLFLAADPHPTWVNSNPSSLSRFITLTHFIEVQMPVVEQINNIQQNKMNFEDLNWRINESMMNEWMTNFICHQIHLS